MSRWGELLDREWLRHDPGRIHPGIALRCTPAIAAIILVGALTGRTTIAAVMCGGALTVGTGVYQRIGRSQIGPMLAATLGMALAATAGTLAGLSPLALVAVVAGAGFLVGMLPALDGGGQWIGQQCAIALLVSSSYPGDLHHALARGAVVLAGGALQIAAIEAMLRFGDLGTELKGWAETMADARRARARLVAALRPNSPFRGFAVRLAVVLSATVMTERLLSLPNGYWVGMTTLLLMRLDFHDTWHRSASRVFGTLAGAAAVLLALRAGAPAWAIAAGVPVTAYLCFAFQQFSYAMLSFCLTGYIVLLLAYGGLQASLVAQNRVVGTLIGAGFALAGHLHFLARARQVPAPAK